ncbi:MAG: L-serine ammonia-lyase, iron-sulfur-dependent, subunit alpha [Gemmatimonadaceae bacterium]|nr:L-serine ammonia-lyase, iron-sulfur-dependent, subunit alpha [Gemmatimonadaceae bacterium]
MISIFNDVIGPVMRGASSSHCAAALRIGRLARDLMGGELTHVLIEFDTNGSLPATHTSQGSDMGLFGGLLGWDAADARLPMSPTYLAQAGVQAEIRYIDCGDPHPNTYRLALSNGTERHTMIAISTGGGMIEVLEIDGQRVSLDGGARVEINGRVLQPVLPVPSNPGAVLPFRSAAELHAHDAGRDAPLWRYAVEYEMARGNLTEAQVLDLMVDIVRILRRSIAEGIAGTSYTDRLLGHQSGMFAEHMQRGTLLNAGVLNRTVLYTTALMEVKSSMGVIVAAPTAGACAALPASCIAVAEEMQLDETAMARAMLAAGLIGVFIAGPWTFAAEVGGCQAEGGSAAAMAAAALVTLAGGTLTQATGAASMALQSMLGLICDPVAARVEIPCLGKNVIAASNAVSCANMALAGFNAMIPFDEVVGAAASVAERMPREHRCTALGGLATTPTALRLSAELAARARAESRGR